MCWLRSSQVGSPERVGGREKERESRNGMKVRLSKSLTDWPISLAGGSSFRGPIRQSRARIQGPTSPSIPTTNPSFFLIFCFPFFLCVSLCFTFFDSDPGF